MADAQAQAQVGALIRQATVALDNHATTTHISQVKENKMEGAHGNNLVRRSNVKYNPRKDKRLRTKADDALNKEALKVPEPTWQECGGIRVSDEAHYKEVANLGRERVAELTGHMKQLKPKDKSGFYRSPAEAAHIRMIQAGRMQFELNRLELLRKRRMALLMKLDKDADGAFSVDEAAAVFKLLYGDTAPDVRPLMLAVLASGAVGAPASAAGGAAPASDRVNGGSGGGEGAGSSAEGGAPGASGEAAAAAPSAAEAEAEATAAAYCRDSLVTQGGTEAATATPSTAEESAAPAPLSREQLISLIVMADKDRKLAMQLEKHDGDGNGLDPQEVLPLLQELAPGVTVETDDVTYLFQICDEDGSGTIDRHEMQILLDTWKEMTKGRPKSSANLHAAAAAKPKPKADKDKAKSSACVLL